jgi:hypothetical protein
MKKNTDQELYNRELFVWERDRSTSLLKVHKREIFYGSDFEFFTIS